MSVAESLSPDFFKRLHQRVEAALAEALWRCLRLLPVDVSSAMGSALLRLVGPRMRVHRLAERNLRRALPELSEAQVQSVLSGMWDNLGRTLGELPHVSRILDPASGRLEIVGGEHVTALRDDGQPGLVFSAHLANWELGPLSSSREGLLLHLFFRAPNNPLVADLYRRIRAGGGECLPKGRDGAKRALQLLAQGEHIGMLVDQKMNDGIPVPFFGRPAMTAPALAQLARRHHCPIVPARVVRLKGAHFRVEVFPPLSLTETDNAAADVRATMEQVNQILEGWVREHPEQWLWVHRRWPKHEEPEKHEETTT